MRNAFRIALAFMAALALYAAPAISAHGSDAIAATCYSSIDVPPDLNNVATVDWSQDPNTCYPNGDSFRICDQRADGWGVTAYLNGTPRTATTNGHPAGYCSGWSTGNLTEDKQYSIDVYLTCTNCLGQYVDTIYVTA